MISLETNKDFCLFSRKQANSQYAQIQIPSKDKLQRSNRYTYRYKNIVSKFQKQNMQGQSKPVWGKLVPLSRGLSTYALKEPSITIGRHSQCQVVIAEKRLSSKHCFIEMEGYNIYLTDMSTNGTYINNQKVGKSNKIEIHNETEIWLLPILRVSQQQTIGFKLVLLGQFLKEYNKAHSPQEKEEIDERKEQNHLTTQKQNKQFFNSLKEQITCCYCHQIMVFPVSIQPCNHRLCGPCLTDLVVNKKDLCIVCRKKMETAARDAAFNSIIEDYLKSHPNQTRNNQDQAPNIFGYLPKNIGEIINQKEEQVPQKKGQQISNGQAQEDKQLIEGLEVMEIQQPQTQQKSKRKKSSDKKETKKQTKRTTRKSKRDNRFVSSDISASTDSQPQTKQQSNRPTVICRQCTEERKGFKCGPSQVHINCHNCSKPFAKRQGQKLYQSCTICNSYFCNLYLPPCQMNGPKLILLGNRGPTCLIQPLYFRNNRVQMDAFRNLLVSEKKKVGDMFHEMMELAEAGRFEFMYDRRLMRSNVAVQKTVRINKRSPICDNCWRQLWFQMIFMYVKQNSYLMPETIKNRPVCYWGINCRTMEHNIEHAKKYSHMDYQSRF